MIVRSVKFARGLRQILSDESRPTLEQARAELRRALSQREARFLSTLDLNVWDAPESPHKKLLNHAGIKRGDVEYLVMKLGLEEALETLRDEGVYVSYEEYQGRLPARRGSALFEFSPLEFANPRVVADLMGSSSGTRSEGVAVKISFSRLGKQLTIAPIQEQLWGTERELPRAVWLPVLPSAAGLLWAIGSRAAGYPMERWFSQVDPRTKTAFKKKAAIVVVPPLSRLLRRPIPKPEYAPISDPEPVLQWCLDALRKSKRARLSTYSSSGARLAQVAWEKGFSLEGLILTATGEPLSAPKVETCRRVGIATTNTYGFIQLGSGGMNCPYCAPEEFHVREDQVAVIPRRRARADGKEVSAFLWTGLDEDAPSVFLNTENDDYGEFRIDSEPCSCEFGLLGYRRRIANIRGMSKIVAGGITLPGEVLEELVEVVLPKRFGGGPGDYQFVERDRGGQTSLVLRVDPRLGEVDEAAAISAVLSFLPGRPGGELASKVWASGDSLKIERQPVLPSKSGKVLAVESLKLD
jgi:hypothetical protein